MSTSVYVRYLTAGSESAGLDLSVKGGWLYSTKYTAYFDSSLTVSYLSVDCDYVITAHLLSLNSLIPITCYHLAV